MTLRFNHSNFHAICDELAQADADLAMIINDHGYPPLWSRPNTFETLVHIILEQQVSLASALSAYLMFVLQRADIFPIGDLAAVNAMKRVKGLPKETTREDLLLIAEQWQPYRTVATMVLWHLYLSAPRSSQPYPKSRSNGEGLL